MSIATKRIISTLLSAKEGILRPTYMAVMYTYDLHSRGGVVNSHDISNRNEFESQLKSFIKEAKYDLNICREVVTKSHEPGFLEEFEKMIKRVEKSSNQLYRSGKETDPILIKATIIKIVKEINEGIRKVDLLINETKIEIEEL